MAVWDIRRRRRQEISQIWYRLDLLKFRAGLEKVLGLEQVGDINDGLPLKTERCDIACQVCGQRLLRSYDVAENDLSGNLLMSCIYAAIDTDLVPNLFARDLDGSALSLVAIKGVRERVNQSALRGPGQARQKLGRATTGIDGYLPYSSPTTALAPWEDSQG